MSLLSRLAAPAASDGVLPSLKRKSDADDKHSKVSKVSPGSVSASASRSAGGAIVMNNKTLPHGSCVDGPTVPVILQPSVEGESSVARPWPEPGHDPKMCKKKRCTDCWRILHGDESMQSFTHSSPGATVSVQVFRITNNEWSRPGVQCFFCNHKAVTSKQKGTKFCTGMVRPYVTRQLQQHCETDYHMHAVSEYFEVPVVLSTARTGFGPGIPSVKAWKLALVAAQKTLSRSSYNAVAECEFGKESQHEMSKLQWIMTDVLRRPVQAALCDAQARSLSVDAKAPITDLNVLVCDSQLDVCEGVVGIARFKPKSFEELNWTSSEKFNHEVLDLIKKFATPGCSWQTGVGIRSGTLNPAIIDSILKSAWMFPDGCASALYCCRNFAGEHLKGTPLVERDLLHELRLNVRNPILGSSYVAEVRESFTDIYKSITYSSRKCDEWVAAQAIAIQKEGSQGGGLKKTLRNCSYAPQRFGTDADAGESINIAVTGTTMYVSRQAEMDSGNPKPVRERMTKNLSVACCPEGWLTNAVLTEWVALARDHLFAPADQDYLWAPGMPRTFRQFKHTSIAMFDKGGVLKNGDATSGLWTRIVIDQLNKSNIFTGKQGTIHALSGPDCSTTKRVLRRQQQICLATYAMCDQTFDSNLLANIMEAWDLHQWWAIWAIKSHNKSRTDPCLAIDAKHDPVLNWSSPTENEGRLMDLYRQFCEHRHTQHLPGLFHMVMFAAAEHYDILVQRLFMKNLKKSLAFTSAKQSKLVSSKWLQKLLVTCLC